LGTDQSKIGGSEREWLMVGTVIVIALIAFAALTLYYFPMGSIQPTSYSPSSETFYYSVSSGYTNSSSSISYSHTTVGIIGNVTISISCMGCVYSGWYNTTSILQTGSETTTYKTSNILNGTGVQNFLIPRGQAIHWTVSWRFNMITEQNTAGSFSFLFRCPNSSLPIVSLGPVNSEASNSQGPLVYTLGTFSDLNNSS
jgi:hypothetical protein